MKYFVFLIALLFTNCAVNQTPPISENSTQPTSAQSPKAVSSSSSSPNNFDKSLPPKVREALENADEFEIWTLDENLEYPSAFIKFHIGSFEISGNKLTKVAKDETRTQLLEGFYDDVKTGGAEAACFKPHHTIIVDYNDQEIAIAICFHCGKFVGNISTKQVGQISGGKTKKEKLKGELFRGSFPNAETSKSFPVFSRITETK
jgi:hypothetical protein